MNLDPDKRNSSDNSEDQLEEITNLESERALREAEAAKIKSIDPLDPGLHKYIKLLISFRSKANQLTFHTALNCINLSVNANGRLELLYPLTNPTNRNEVTKDPREARQLPATTPDYWVIRSYYGELSKLFHEDTSSIRDLNLSEADLALVKEAYKIFPQIASFVRDLTFFDSNKNLIREVDSEFEKIKFKDHNVAGYREVTQINDYLVTYIAASSEVSDDNIKKRNAVFNEFLSFIKDIGPQRASSLFTANQSIYELLAETLVISFREIDPKWKSKPLSQPPILLLRSLQEALDWNDVDVQHFVAMGLREYIHDTNTRYERIYGGLDSVDEFNNERRKEFFITARTEQEDIKRATDTFQCWHYVTSLRKHSAIYSQIARIEKENKVIDELIETKTALRNDAMIKFEWEDYKRLGAELDELYFTSNYNKFEVFKLNRDVPSSNENQLRADLLHGFSEAVSDPIVHNETNIFYKWQLYLGTCPIDKFGMTQNEIQFIKKRYQEISELSPADQSRVTTYASWLASLIVRAEGRSVFNGRLLDSTFSIVENHLAQKATGKSLRVFLSTTGFLNIELLRKKNEEDYIKNESLAFKQNQRCNNIQTLASSYLAKAMPLINVKVIAEPIREETLAVITSCEKILGTNIIVKTNAREQFKGHLRSLGSKVLLDSKTLKFYDQISRSFELESELLTAFAGQVHHSLPFFALTRGSINNIICNRRSLIDDLQKGETKSNFEKEIFPIIDEWSNKFPRSLEFRIKIEEMQAKISDTMDRRVWRYLEAITSDEGFNGNNKISFLEALRNLFSSWFSKGGKKINGRNTTNSSALVRNDSRDSSSSNKKNKGKLISDENDSIVKELPTRNS